MSRRVKLHVFMMLKVGISIRLNESQVRFYKHLCKMYGFQLRHRKTSYWITN